MAIAQHLVNMAGYGLHPVRGDNLHIYRRHDQVTPKCTGTVETSLGRGQRNQDLVIFIAKDAPLFFGQNPDNFKRRAVELNLLAQRILIIGKQLAGHGGSQYHHPGPPVDMNLGDEIAHNQADVADTLVIGHDAGDGALHFSLPPGHRVRLVTVFRGYGH